MSDTGDGHYRRVEHRSIELRDGCRLAARPGVGGASAGAGGGVVAVAATDHSARSGSAHRPGVAAVGGDMVSETEDDFGAVLDPGTGLETASSVRQRFSIRADDPLSARAEAWWTHELARGDWRVRTESRTMMRADAGYFHLEAQLLAFEQGVPVFDRRWQERIARSLL